MYMARSKTQTSSSSAEWTPYETCGAFKHVLFN